jgi:DNA-binding transcriptional LysR family regulator
LGIAYIPDFVAGDALTAGQLRRVLEQHATVEGPFSVVWPTSRHMVPRLRAFVDFVSETLFRAPGDTRGP